MWNLLLVLVISVLTAEVNGGHRSPYPYSNDKWSYVGCYRDGRPRDLTSYHKDESSSGNMDLERCYRFCSGYKAKYMALQDGNECRCDNNYGRYGLRSDSRDCNTPCSKRRSRQICGGDMSNSIYRIRDSAATSITPAMMSLSTTKDKLVFTSIGDWGRRGSNQRAVARQLGEWSEEHDSAFTAAIGDNFYENGVASATDDKFNTVWKDVYTHQSLQNPWVVIEGNHDYYNGHAPNQLKHADTDKQWVMPSLYYSMIYRFGNKTVHFIFLDTDPIRQDSEYHQYNWFRKELESSTADWRIVIGHHPVFSSSSHGSERSTSTMYRNIRGHMIKHKVALYICGHDHNMEHLSDSSGIVEYVISGSAAKRSDGKSRWGRENVEKKEAVSRFFRSEYGFTGFTIRDYTVNVQYIDRYGNLVYQFTKLNPNGLHLDRLSG